MKSQSSKPRIAAQIIVEINTTRVEEITSLRDGHETFLSSPMHSLTNCINLFIYVTFQMPNPRHDTFL